MTYALVGSRFAITGPGRFSIDYPTGAANLIGLRGVVVARRNHYDEGRARPRLVG